jgi:isopentenyl diphosphate isomerase/L-lactate dehydrogenase-like FMN-dependent dehydrogenase
MRLLRRFLEQRHAGAIPHWAEAVSQRLTIDDLRRLMEHRVPPVVTDYFLGGAGSEQAMRDNVEAFARARFNPPYGVKLAEIDLATTVLGHTISMPVIAAPVGLRVRPWG